MHVRFYNPTAQRVGGAVRDLFGSVAPESKKRVDTQCR